MGLPKRSALKLSGRDGRDCGTWCRASSQNLQCDRMSAPSLASSSLFCQEKGHPHPGTWCQKLIGGNVGVVLMAFSSAERLVYPAPAGAQ